MYNVDIYNLPEFCQVDINKSVVEIYAPYDLELRVPNQMKPILIKGLRLELSDDVIGVPFLDGAKYCKHSLYHPKGFTLKRSCSYVTLYICSRKGVMYSTKINKGDYLGSYKFMTTQFYKLNCRRDGSDKGLRSAKINFKIYGSRN